MKKNIFTVFGLGAAFFLQAQQHSALYEELGRQHAENLRKFSEFSRNMTARRADSAAGFERKNLATVVNGMPLFWKSEDVKANNATNVTPLQNGSVAGQGLPIDGSGINILIMDTGKIFANHQEFGNASRIVLKETDAAAYSPHSTMVAGVMGAAGVIANAKGVLPKATFNNYFFGTTSLGTNYQKLEAATGANISNHSYGTNLGWSRSGSSYYWFGDYELYKTTKADTYGGSYHELDANYDKIVYSNPNHIVVKSAGNYYGIGPTSTSTNYRYDAATNSYVLFSAGEELPPSNCKNGYYCIGWGALAKNVITVGSANQLTAAGNTYTSPADVTRSSDSSAGPRRDGAVKPDITAVGASMYVPTYTTDTGTTSYATASGTSLAAAMISGIAGALTQLNRNLTGNQAFVYQADEMKTLLAHTANEAGNAGPDGWYGWGLADAKSAAEVIINKNQNKVIFEQKTLTSGTPQTFEITAGTEPLKVTMSWVDPAAVPFTTSSELQNNTASRIINDLDLRITDTVSGTVYYPWKLNVADPMAPATTGDNTADNVEQVVVNAPIVGRVYKVTVSNKGNLVDAAGAASTSKYTVLATSTKSNSLSIAEGLPSDCESITAYPARTKDIVTVIVPMPGEKISVYDMSGKQVINVRQPNSQQLDFSLVPKGVYLIHVKTKYCNKTRKIIRE